MWFHLAVEFNSGTMLVFKNGIQIGSLSGVSFNNIVKISNFFGKSNWVNDPLLNDAVIDELKIFNRPLNSSEITNEMTTV